VIRSRDRDNATRLAATWRGTGHGVMAFRIDPA